MSRARSATVFTHRRPNETAEALACLLSTAREAGVTLRFEPRETEKHELHDGEGIVTNADVLDDVDLAITLGGDGTILNALRAYAGTDVPVFAVNFGEIGFLATIEPTDVRDGFRRAFDGDFEVLRLPAIALSGGTASGHAAMNDVSFQRLPGKRVADLAYAVGEDEIGRVRCDGLVVATPAGSTGYNLANGGPVMAWGVAGYAVSFVAPHSLTARSLVVAPADPMRVENRSREEPAEVSVDGRPVARLGPGESLELRFVPDQGCLAQLPGSSFYHRLRDKFGRLAN